MDRAATAMGTHLCVIEKNGCQWLAIPVPTEGELKRIDSAIEEAEPATPVVETANRVSQGTAG